MPLAAVLRLLRPKQWAKNFLVLAAYLFTASWQDPSRTSLVLIAFGALCMLSSASYVFNDLADAKADRLHPRKKLRPIASGQFSSGVAIGIGVALIVGGFALSALLPSGAQVALAFFAMIQLAYNLGLKRVAILDVMVISLAFVQRAVIGAMAIEVAISGWLLFCTGAFALFLASVKRRQELRALGTDSMTRATLAGYSERFLDAMVIVAASFAGISYGIYSIESDTARLHPSLILTTPVVVFGILRYLYLVFGREEGEEPESVVFKDPQMVLSLIAFLLVAVLAMRGLKLDFLAS
ncbi:MAG: UbiA prenyltransferase family protein [Armatimonadetes bacterium]|nr:UbiA prenyltransferase family protein [Armatimonadota bacterium]